MGKHKYIETPEKMWELFCAYKDNLKPREVQKATPRGVVSEFHTPPLTIEGFENYVADLGVINDLGDYFANTGDNYSAYSTICSRIKRVVRQDQIEGGMVGQYNPSITQRLNGLTEKQETTHKGSIEGIKIEIIKPNDSKS